MTEIFNLRTLCRCCHTDGDFKNLQLSYVHDNRIEIYASMLQETFNITIQPPPFEGSYMICETCIGRLREALNFKHQVLLCEHKFEEYCKNEQLFTVKEELEYKSNSDAGSDTEDINRGYEDDANRNLRETHIKSYIDDKNFVKDEFNVNAAEQPKHFFTTVPIEYNRAEEVKKSVPIIKAEDKPKQQKQLQLDSNHEARVETEEGHRYACKQCDKNFKLLKLLRRHIAIQHKECYKCKICSYQCTGWQHYKKHSKTHSSKLKYLKCRFCAQIFKTKYSLYQHVNMHKKRDQYQCDKCLKFFANKQTLSRHIFLHDGADNIFICDVCERGFNNKSNLSTHIEVVHEKRRPFKCTQCPKTFTANQHLKLHVLLHTGEKPFKCETCLGQYVNPWGLKRHHCTTNGVKIKLYTCRMCNLKCESRGKLMEHSKTHIGHKTYKCHLCPRDFTCKYTFNRHVNSHSGEKPYKCDMCSKAYTQKCMLNRHKKIIHDPNTKHNRVIKRLKCDLCNKSFRDIEKHMKSHSIRPHVCEICSKSFPERNTLKRHIEYVHHGRKPHQCTLCEKKYAKAYGLRRHMKTTHGLEIKKEDEVEEPQ